MGAFNAETDKAMAFDFPPDTKFAAIHLARCSSRGLPNTLTLNHGLSVHSRPVIDLSDMDKARLGTDRTEEFEDSIALMASKQSDTAGILDAESRQLEHRANMLLYGVLMQGIPQFGNAILTLGSRQGERDPWANSIAILARYYRHPHVVTFRVSPDALCAAEIVVAGLIEVFPGPQVPEFTRLRRGVRSLETGWRGERATDRIHLFVRALDGLMRLPQSAGEREFVTRVSTIAAGNQLEGVAREIYRLRSYDEHLSDWPSKLGYIKERDRDRFVSHRAFQAETLAGEAYRQVLSDAALRANFKTNADIDNYWAAGGPQCADKIDLDAHDARYRFIGNL